jgi:hypothetical protein
MKMKFLNDNKTKKSLLALLIYVVLTMYYFGTVIMAFFVCYPQFEKVHEHFTLLMEVFNSHMIWVGNLPAFLMLASSFLPLLFPEKAFPKPAIFASIGLALISAGTTFFVVLPVHYLLPTLGFSDAIVQKIHTVCIWFQIIPAAIQVLIVIGVVNRLLRDTRPLARWLFMTVIFLLFFTWGTSYIDEFVNFPVYLTVGVKDWMAYRFGIPQGVFFGVFLIPGYFPLLLTIPMFWQRPKGIPRRLVTISLISILWIFIITAIYFVPHIQAPLDKGYAEPLIKDILRYSFPLRGTAGLVLFITAGLMFFKAGQYKIQNAKTTS